jgi:hypothetical protein
MRKPVEIPQFMEFANMTAAVLTKEEQAEQGWVRKLLGWMIMKPPAAPTLEALAILGQRARTVFHSLDHQMLLSIGGERFSGKMFKYLTEASLAERIKESGWTYASIRSEAILSPLRTPDGPINLDSMWRSFFNFLNDIKRYPCLCPVCDRWFVPHLRSPLRRGNIYCGPDCKSRMTYKKSHPNYKVPV